MVEEKDDPRWETQSLGATTAPDGDDDIAFDPDIDNEYIQQLSVMSVKTCKVCMRLSTDINPFTRGHKCRSRKYPTWPWLYGSYSEPRGAVCRVCQHAFIWGSFAAEFATIDDLVDSFKSSKEGCTHTDEFAKVCDTLIEKVNAGKITQRLRGAKKTKIMAQMLEERKKVVELVKSTGVRVRARFSAMLSGGVALPG